MNDCDTNNILNCCLISGTVLSPSLLRAVERQAVPIYVQQPTPPIPKTIRVLEEAELLSLLQNPHIGVLMNWEKSLDLIFHDLPSNKLEPINVFKDKVAFRELLKKYYPDFFYRGVPREELREFRFPNQLSTMVIQPSIGIFSLGVRVVGGQQEWSEAVDGVLKELDAIGDSWDQRIISNTRFLVEDYIDGKEFACDGFWNSNGEVVITCIYRHPFANKRDVRHVVYDTSREIMVEMLESTMSLLEKIGSKVSLRRFPFHLEFRQSQDGTLIPLELNPLRYGGIALADLPEYAFGFNPYELFFTDAAPDWDRLLADESNSQTYAFIVGNIPPHYDADKYSIDQEHFCSVFGDKLLNYLPSIPEITTVFGVAYIRTESFEDTLAYLDFDFDSFLRPHQG